MATAKPITLLPAQIAHVDKLTDILTRSPFALDLSALGSGKTYASSFIAMREPERFKHVIVIAPVSVKVKWMQMKKDYGVPVSAALSYCELRSVKFKQPKHGLLHRRDYKVQMNIAGRVVDVDKCDFTVSDKFRKMVDEGVLMVVDEIQNIKNINPQFHAAQALIKHVVDTFTINPAAKSRVLLLSGSPIDKAVQAIHMFRCLGIMKADKLASYDFRNRTVVWEGLQEIIDYANTVNKHAMDHLIMKNGGLRYINMTFRDARTTSFCYNVFQEVIKPKIYSAMAPPNMGFKLNISNGFYHIIDDAEAALLTDAVYNLGNAARFNNERLNGTMDIQSLRSISVAMLQIETAKIGTFVRLAQEALENHPNQKIAICVNYSTTIKDLVAALHMYQPLVLNGTVSAKARGKVLDKFQAPTTESRVIIGNLSVMSTGIDLDDKDGRFPRIAFVSPNYSTINLYQLGFRFLRADSKSPTDMYYVYGAHARENNILAALAAKSKIMKETTPEQADHGVVFPSDNQSFTELPPPGFVVRQRTA